MNTKIQKALLFSKLEKLFLRNTLENQIIKAAKHQFKEGDVMHWWHEHNQSGIRTKISDDF